MASRHRIGPAHIGCCNRGPKNCLNTRIPARPADWDRPIIVADGTTRTWPGGAWSEFETADGIQVPQRAREPDFRVHVPPRLGRYLSHILKCDDAGDEIVGALDAINGASKRARKALRFYERASGTALHARRHSARAACTEPAAIPDRRRDDIANGAVHFPVRDEPAESLITRTDLQADRNADSALLLT